MFSVLLFFFFPFFFGFCFRVPFFFRRDWLIGLLYFFFYACFTASRFIYVMNELLHVFSFGFS